MNLIRDLFGQAPALDSASHSLEEILLLLIVSFVLSQALSAVYIWTHHGVSYSKSLVQSLVLLSIIVTTLMLAVGDSLARAFGLFGALAIVRFRTPVKDSRDAVYLFMSVAVGISCGTGSLRLAVLGTAFLLTIAVYLGLSRFGERIDQDGVLRLIMPPAGDQDPSVRRLLRDHCEGYTLVHLRETGSEGEMEFSFQLRLFDAHESSELVRDLQSLSNIKSVNYYVQHESTEL